ncbi:MAG: T9SS type A sorting domain-containing protein [Candidatus Krumholzibacteriota bacterium]|nr:T9SS type A sorting domain-containing protein [Candidatus Krumholzibacteriota bacterium]
MQCVCARAMPVLEVCLAWGILHTVACAWSPPTGEFGRQSATSGEPPQSLPPVHMHPGERSQEAFPIPASTSEQQSYNYTLKGAPGLSFRSVIQTDNAPMDFQPVLAGVLTPREDASAETFVWIGVDSAIAPGETLSVDYTLTPSTDPTHTERWRRLVVVQEGPAQAEDPAEHGPTLHPCYPNPSSSTATISFYLPRPAEMGLSIYDSKGRRVTTLASGYHPVGVHTITWSGTDASGRTVAAGVYFVRLHTGGVSVARKIVLLK